MSEVEFDDRLDRVDRDWLWSVLTEVYWGKERTREMFEAQLDSAWRVVGAYEQATGRMVGFARAVSDGVALAYLADVYVAEDLRGQGLGQRLLHAMIEDGPGRGFRWLLHTDDAHGLYERFGFTRPGPTSMERPSRLPHVRD